VAHVAFLSDYGLTDEFVGVCKGVIASIAPEARVIDLTHEIPPHDVRAGALALVRSIQYLPTATIVLAVVDPGVGTERRLIGVDVGSGFLLGPDNGLLAPAVAMVGGARRVVELTNLEFQLPAPGATFAGRDVLAPAAGQLAAGTGFDELGEPVDPAGLTPGLVPVPQVAEDGATLVEVLWVDRFGNAQLNVGAEDLGIAVGDGVELRIGDRARRARLVRTYADARPSELVLVVDGYGLVSLAIDRASAAAECGLQAGSTAEIRTPPILRETDN
jgi:S-adenosylmethionine hydrolase